MGEFNYLKTAANRNFFTDIHTFPFVYDITITLRFWAVKYIDKQCQTTDFSVLKKIYHYNEFVNFLSYFCANLRIYPHLKLIVSMNFLPAIVKKGALLGFVFSLSFIGLKAQDGKAIFSSKCQTCHAIDKDATGPALRDVETRGPWTDRANLIKWVHNPSLFLDTDPYAKALMATFGGQRMPAFPDLTDAEINAI
ncbi:MAG: c-type cytochrome, partial [Chitinophagaceae bacterium]